MILKRSLLAATGAILSLTAPTSAQADDLADIHATSGTTTLLNRAAALESKNDNPRMYTEMLQYRVSKLLGKDHNKLAWRFTEESQYSALKTMSANKTELSDQDIELALQFTHHAQSNALEFLGANNFEQALSFTKSTQYAALKIIAANKTEFSDQDIDLALKFIEYAQSRALRVFGVKEAQRALEFTQEIPSWALKILGPDEAKLAQEFELETQYAALEFLGARDAKLALRFTTKKRVWALHFFGRRFAYAIILTSDIMRWFGWSI